MCRSFQQYIFIFILLKVLTSLAGKDFDSSLQGPGFESRILHLPFAKKKKKRKA